MIRIKIKTKFLPVVSYLFMIGGAAYLPSLYGMEKEARSEKVIIGVDVGGTNTDAVLLAGDRLIAKVKTTTTDDITTGVVKAISALFENNEHLKEYVSSVNIGTTHLLNALLQRKGLSKPYVVRLAAPATTAVPPAIDWDQQLKAEMLGDNIHIVGGGYEFNGVEISPLDSNILTVLAHQTLGTRNDSVAITGVFSNVNPLQEERTKAIFKQSNPALEVSLSHTMGNIGLLARENATILNACLARQYYIIREAFKDAINHLGMKANVFLTYGDGTKTAFDDGSATPLRTLNSGPINSIKGAAIIAQIKDAVTVDIGGTSSDVGLLKAGEPVNENSHFTIGGINCNFSSARLNSFGLGGGSIIKVDSGGSISIGPESVGKDLFKRALAFGGTMLTPTDIAVALGRLPIGTLNINVLKGKIALFGQGEDIDTFIKKVDRALHQKLAHGVLEILNAMEDTPSALVLVGGGATLFDLQYLKELMPQFKSVLIPQWADVANALGAAVSLIGGGYVHVYDYAKTSRPEAIADATEKAKKNAIAKGADATTLKVSTISEVPLNYLSGDPNQLSVSVVGAYNQDRSQSLQEPSVVILSGSNPESLFVAKDSSKIKVNERENTKGTPTRLQLQGLESLTVTDINDIAAGAGLLGSGGGGSPELGRQMALYALKKGARIQRISFENLPIDAFVVAFGIMGSPAVFCERLPALEEGIKAIEEIEKKKGKAVDALVVMEGGGANATYPLFVAAMLGIPVVDCDCMGRAFPGINMVTPCIYGAFDEHYAALSNGREGILIQGADKSFASLENGARVATIAMGGIVSIAYLPMTGAQVKQWTIKGTNSIAQAMGKALRHSQGEPFNRRLEALNKALASTDYKKAERIFEGKIIAVRRKEADGFSVGGFIVDNQHTKEKVEVGFQNENLIARRQLTGEILAQVPDLIIVVDKNTFQPISCEDLRYGQDVVILKMTAPAMMVTERALKVVGSQAYPMEQIFKLLNSHSTMGDRFSL